MFDFFGLYFVYEFRRGFGSVYSSIVFGMFFDVIDLGEFVSYSFLFFLVGVIFYV